MKSYDKRRLHFKKRQYFADKGLSNQNFDLSSGHVWMWALDHKEGPQKNWCFWTVVLEKTLDSPLDCKEIKPVNSKGNHWTLKLKLQYFGHLMWRASSLEKALMLGKIEGWWRKGWQRMRWLNGTTSSMYMSLSKLWKMVKNREAWCAAVYGVTKCWTLLSNWITTKTGLIPGSGRSLGGGHDSTLQDSWSSLVAQMVKNQPAMRETQVRSLGWEDPLEKEWQPTPVLLPGESPGTD